MEITKSYEHNARTHSDGQIVKIVNSIKADSFLAPIEIDADSVIISGHVRLKGARRAGLIEVPRVTHSRLSKAARKGCILAANRIAANAGWGVIDRAKVLSSHARKQAGDVIICFCDVIIKR